MQKDIKQVLKDLQILSGGIIIAENNTAVGREKKPELYELEAVSGGAASDTEQTGIKMKSSVLRIIEVRRAEGFSKGHYPS